MTSLEKFSVGPWARLGRQPPAVLNFAPGVVTRALCREREARQGGRPDGRDDVATDEATPPQTFLRVLAERAGAVHGAAIAEIASAGPPHSRFCTPRVFLRRRAGPAPSLLALAAGVIHHRRPLLFGGGFIATVRRAGVTVIGTSSSHCDSRPGRSAPFLT
jgi:UDP:flavonoid glycosyltransferase YjiC (YdhE family)